MTPIRDALRLCLVTDNELCASTGVVTTVRTAVAGGVTMVQLRDKHATTAERIKLGRSLKYVLRGTDVLLIINDDIEAALMVGAHGAHVGQDDMPIAEARDMLGPDKLLGLSCGNDAELAALAPSLVDYAGLGPVFSTESKPEHSPPIGIDGLQRLAHASPVPCIAIGGLKQNHVDNVLATGVCGLAVISAICGQSDVEAAARALKGAHEIQPVLENPPGGAAG
ncbi:MAG: thiamine phosphate synthase [Granulosicoccus sp.]